MAVTGCTDLGDGLAALTVDADPTSTAVDALAGSLIIYSGEVYRKTSDGSNTDVQRLVDGLLPLLADWDAGDFDIRAASFSAGGAAVASAIVTLISTTQGFLPPSMTTTQRDAIGSPATGLLLWNSTTARHERYNGSGWAAIGGAGGGDLLSDGTVPLTADWDAGAFDITLAAIRGRSGAAVAMQSAADSVNRVWVEADGDVVIDAPNDWDFKIGGTSLLKGSGAMVVVSAPGSANLRIHDTIAGEWTDLIQEASDGNFSINRLGSGSGDDLVITKAGDVGIRIGNPAAQFHIDQPSTTGAKPVLYLDQADVSEEMIRFMTTIGEGNPIEAVGAKSLTTTHFLKVVITGGLTRYFPIGTIA